MKNGIRSSEFWLNIIGLVGGLTIACLGESQWTAMAGAVLSAVCGASYTYGRSMVKGKEALGAAQVAASQNTVKKP